MVGLWDHIGAFAFQGIYEFQDGISEQLENIEGY
jgi:hypothetical protein